jgi:hypothetical protein
MCSILKRVVAVFDLSSGGGYSCPHIPHGLRDYPVMHARAFGIDANSDSAWAEEPLTYR